MSMGDRRNAAKRLENLFNLSRPGHGDRCNPQWAATNGYPTKASDFEGQGWRAYVNGDFQITRVFVNEFENTDGTVDKGVTIVVKIVGDPQLEGDNCRLTFRGLQKAEEWDDPKADEDFFSRSDREQFEQLFDVFTAINPAFKENEKLPYADVAGLILSSAKTDLQDKYFNGSVKLECYKPKADPEAVKGPYASLVRARAMSDESAESLGLNEEMPF